MNCPYPQNCLPRYLLNNLIKHGICPSMYFFWCEGLNRMLNQDDFEVRQTQRFRLCECGIGEFRSRKHRRRDTGFFEKDSVVHTARGTRPSIGKGFYQEVALLSQLLANVFWSRAGERGLHAPDDFAWLKAFRQDFLHPV